MTRTPARQPPTRYRLRVAGHLDQHWADWFGELTLTHDDDGTTSLTGVVADQAQLHGQLTKIRDLGVTLISVEIVEPRHGVADDCASHPTREAGDHVGRPAAPAAPRISPDAVESEMSTVERGRDVVPGRGRDDRPEQVILGRVVLMDAVHDIAD